MRRRYHYEKVCPVCGKEFKSSHKAAVCCSRGCANTRSAVSRGLKLRASLRQSPAAKRREMRERLAARDAEYAAAGFPVTVELRDGRSVETRGQRCIGAHAAPFIKHS